MPSFFFILVTLGLLLGESFASQTTDWRSNHLFLPEKITVGPWDNFGTSLSPAGDDIYYTRDRNQILSLFKHNVTRKEGEALDFVEGDAKQVVINHSGKALAYTYFGDDAQGDICLYFFEKKPVHCLSSNSRIEQSPFWLTENQVGYLSRKAESLQWDLIIYDLISTKSKKIAEGFISSPTASRNGQFILYTDQRETGQVVMLYNVASASERTLPDIHLPGLMGFSAFSIAGDFLYFSHYLNDTNADQMIDANDNSVIFRLPFDQWQRATQGVYPEQLTSVDYNCKYPKPGKIFLYLTCAFEGSLDVYRLPLAGMVPSHWGNAQLEEAHSLSRRYEQRLLLLNALSYQKTNISPEGLQRIIGNHLQVGEIAAARYYIAQLIALYKKIPTQTDIASFYQALDALLNLKSEKNKHQNDIVTIKFRQLAEKTKQKIESLAGPKEIREFALAVIEHELGNSREALKRLDFIKLETYSLELSKYFVITLYESLLPKNSPRFMQLYPQLFNDMSTSFEFRLFYAFNYLKVMGDDFRLNAIDEIKDKKIHRLFQADVLARNLAKANNLQAKTKVYRALSQLLKENRKDYSLRKAMHVRAMQVLSNDNDNKFMELVSRHWLTVSHVTEMEFYYVANQYERVNKDKAYAFMQQEQLAKAFNTFYPVIRQTGSLEAYYQYMTLGLGKNTGQRETLEKSLAVLKKQNLLGENEKYTQALRLLIRTQGTAQYEKSLDEALSLILSMQLAGPASAMHELLQGFIYHKKMQVSQEGYNYNKRFYQNAHYHYVLALDLAQDNGRISATVWQNLGWLHKSVGQYALATSYFQRREKYPFINDASEHSLRWVLAKAYFYNRQPIQAYEQIKKLLDKPKKKNILPLKEKAAFYAMQAKKYDEAILLYDEIFSSEAQIDDLNNSKMKMAYAYALSKTGDEKKAIKQFEAVLSISDRLNVLPMNNQRRVVFNPLKQKLLANGFLSALSEKVEDKEKYLQARIAILSGLKEAKDISFDEMSKWSFLVKDLQNLSLIYEAQGKQQDMLASMKQSLDAAESWAKVSANDMGPVVYRALVNYLSLAISHEKLFAGHEHEKLEALYHNLNKAFSSFPYPTPVNIFHQAKIRILWSAYLRDVRRTGSFGGEQIILDESVSALSKNATEKYRELEKLVAYFSH